MDSRKIAPSTFNICQICLVFDTSWQTSHHFLNLPYSYDKVYGVNILTIKFILKVLIVY